MNIINNAKTKPPTLRDKFIHDFLFIMIIAIVSTITFSVVSLFLYTNRFFDFPIIKSTFNDLEYSKAISRIRTVQKLQQNLVDSLIHTAEQFREAYNFLADVYSESSISSKEMEDAINENIFNALDDDKTILQKNSKFNIQNAINYGRWFLNKDDESLDSKGISEKMKKELFILNSMIIYFKSFYQLHIKSKDNIHIKVFFEETEMYFDYPYRNQDQAHFSLPMEQWCKKSGKILSYYYFKCNNLYIRAKENYQKNKYRYTLGTVYKNNKYSTGIDDEYNYFPLCLNMTEPKYDKTSSSPDSSILICISYEINLIIKQYDYFGAMLQGYFYVATKGSKIPFYYPKVMRTNELEVLLRNEFSLNSSYYLDEIIEYSKIEELLEESLKEEDKGDVMNLVQSNLLIGGRFLNYTLVPIYFRFDGETSLEKMTGHSQTIVYVFDQEKQFRFKGEGDKMIIENIWQLITFATLGIAIIILFLFLVGSIADNIVRPIKIIKNVLLRINDKKVNEIFPSKKKENEVENTEQSNNEPNQNLVQPLRKNNITVEDLDEEDEEFINTRPEDVNSVFLKLVNLKNSLQTLNNESLTLEDGNLLHYIFAQHNFHIIGNEQASKLCSSNIGNLLTIYDQFDKSIFHLNESVKDVKNLLVEKIDLYSVKSLKSFIVENSFLAKKTKTLKEIEYAKKTYLESRYPKLIYSHRKGIKKLKKLFTCKNFRNMPPDQDAFFLERKYHSFTSYKERVTEYLHLSLFLGDIYNATIALTLYINYLLDYELESEENIRFILHLITLLPSKENQSKEQQHFNTTKLVHILNNLKSNDEIDSIEIPNTVLIQNSNYIIGKFYFLCGHYNKSLTYFYHAMKNELVSNASIVKKSMKKIIKIATIIRDNISTAYLPKQKINSQTLEEKLDMYIKSKNDKMKLLKFYPKDICIVISSADSSIIKTQIDITLYIFDNFISDFDQWCVVYYPPNAEQGKIIIQLTDKNKENQMFIHDYLKNCNFSDEEESLNYSESAENLSHSWNIIKWAKDYLFKKSGGVNSHSKQEPREKWIIYLCHKLTKKDTEIFKENDVKKDLFSGSPFANLVIVTFSGRKRKGSEDVSDRAGFSEEEGRYYGYENEIKKCLNFNKSDVISYEDLDILKERMKIKGTISKQVLFSQEKYNWISNVK